ncbi:MAG TPA: inositol monophosphatase family protein, partial [Victivallales bacterium]|nr:inositol monophosphatase family protein [Victivallales bacterium]
MREWDPARVCALMIESARIAKGMFSSFKWSRKEDSSLVTKADIAIEKLFSKYCDCPEENVFFIGEETVDSKSEEYIKNAMSGVAWIIDPIDGTAPFACNIPTWGISVAFAVDGIIKDGAIYLPSAGEIYISYEGESYFSDKILGSTRYINLSKIPPPSANIASGALISISQDVAKKGRMEIENPVQAVCCSVFSAAGLLR